MEAKYDLVPKLLEIGVLKFGDFILKSGASSPVYIDLRIIINYPSLIKELANAIWAEKLRKNIDADIICGVPYTALPIASALSIMQDVPMVMKRKEPKSYGTKKMIEGIVRKGDKCLIIEDIVSTGSSIIETVEVLREAGLSVTDCIVIIDRRQGGQEHLLNQGIRLHSLFNFADMISTLYSHNLLESTLVERIRSYLNENKYIPIPSKNLKVMPFSARSDACKQPIAKWLFKIIDEKKSNLCVAVDTIYSKDLLNLADILGPHICMLKTHIDILSDFDFNVIFELCELAKKHNFILFEDRKFADIGNTVKLQYEEGIYKIKKWADIVTVHTLPGEGVIEALHSHKNKPTACVLVAEMSSKGNLTDGNYITKSVAIAKKYRDFVIGFVCQQKLSEDNTFIHMFPGVKLNASGDHLGQQYKTPEDAVKEGADIIIVGRGICEATDIVQTAQEYKNRSYAAYLNKIA